MSIESRYRILLLAEIITSASRSKLLTDSNRDSSRSLIIATVVSFHIQYGQGGSVTTLCKLCNSHRPFNSTVARILWGNRLDRITNNNNK